MSISQIQTVSGDEGWLLIQPLELEVYPPEVMASVPWRSIVWSHAEKRVLVLSDGQIVSHAGVYRRQGTVDGKRALIGGIGGVMTSALHRRKGFASQAMKAASALLDEYHVDFSVLFCEQHNEQFYEGLGWRKFGGKTYCEQPTGRTLFDVMGTMIQASPNTHHFQAIDLCGLPW